MADQHCSTFDLGSWVPWTGCLWDSRGVVNNLTAELIWTLLAFVIVAGTAFFLLTRDHRARIAFFGLDRRCPYASIFVSNVCVRESVAFEELKMGYRGPAFTKIEYDAAREIEDELCRRPMVVVLEPVQNWISRTLCRNMKVRTEIRLSPGPDRIPDDVSVSAAPSLEGRITDLCNVSVGGPIYNSVAKWCFEKYLPDPANGYENRFEFGRNAAGERVIRQIHGKKGYSSELPRSAPPDAPGADRDMEPAVIVRLRHEGKTVFLCAGIADWATAQSVRHLAQNWGELHRLMGDKEFGVALMCEPLGTKHERMYRAKSMPPFALKPA